MDLRDRLAAATCRGVPPSNSEQGAVKRAGREGGGRKGGREEGRIIHVATEVRTYLIPKLLLQIRKLISGQELKIIKCLQSVCRLR